MPGMIGIKGTRCPMGLKYRFKLDIDKSPRFALSCYYQPGNALLVSCRSRTSQHETNISTLAPGWFLFGGYDGL